MLYILTGIQKSGNSWIGRMVRSLCMESSNPESLRSWLRSHEVNQTAMAYNRQAEQKIRPQQLLRQLVLPDSIDPLKLSSEDEALMRKALLWSASSVRRDLARAGRRTLLTVSEIAARMTQQLLRREKTTPGLPSFWVGPAKHTHVQQVRRSYPDAKVLWIVRDPRDVLISFFYHDLATLAPFKMRWLLETAYESPRPVFRSEGEAIHGLVAARAKQISEFYQRSLANPAQLHPSQVLVVRYEKMLKNCPDQLQRIAQFLQLPVTARQTHEVCERFRFAAITKDDTGVSLVRKAVAGDWRNYLDKSYAALLHSELAKTVRDLGYEQNDDWIEALPDRADLRLDLSMFRPKSSAVYSFESLWLEDEGLQRQFPLLHSSFDRQSFHQWLRQCKQDNVVLWFRVARGVADRFGFVTNERRGKAEEILGF